MTSTRFYTEKDLLWQVAQGDETAFRQLYEQWQPQLASFIFRISKSKELTAEIVQDVFLKIWMTRETLTTIDNFRSYLFVISRNQALNMLRKQMRELNLFEKWEKTNIDNEPESADRLAVQLSLVDEAIDRLSPRQREVYLLHRHERFTYQQIAEQLGIGKESVKTHLELAIKSITKYLKGRLAVTALLIETISNYF